MLEEQDRLESLLHAGTAEDMNETVQLLSDLEQDLDDLEADTAEQRANELLKGLRFTSEMIEGPAEHLSGGWRMRLAIAQALFVQSDLILLDEVRFVHDNRKRIFLTACRSQITWICTDWSG